VHAQVRPPWGRSSSSFEIVLGESTRKDDDKQQRADVHSCLTSNPYRGFLLRCFHRLHVPEGRFLAEELARIFSLSIKPLRVDLNISEYSE